jgi:hypothetical protein
MENIKKPNIAGTNDKFYSLIDRLQICSENKNPSRKWSNNVYYDIAFQWLGNEEELEELVNRLETELNLSKNLE